MFEARRELRTRRPLPVDHKKLAIAVDFAITTCEVGYKPHEVKPPDAAELDEIHAVIEILDVRVALVEVRQPLFQRPGIVHAVEIPAIYSLEVLVVGRNRIEAPVSAVGEDVFVSVDTGNVIGRPDGNNVEEEPSACGAARTPARASLRS